MEFKNRQKLNSKLVEFGKRLIDEVGVLDTLRNEYLHDIHSHFIVSKEGNYDDTAFNRGLVPERIEALEKAFNEGCTIVVKEMENWNPAIMRRCREFKAYVDVHMYVSPANGSGFDWHTDDKHVYVHMQLGEKLFEVEEPDGTISKYLLKPGEVLFIPYGAKHRAFAGTAPSVHLGFGVWPEQVSIQNAYSTFDVEIEMNLK